MNLRRCPRIRRPALETLCGLGTRYATSRLRQNPLPHTGHLVAAGSFSPRHSSFIPPPGAVATRARELARRELVLCSDCQKGVDLLGHWPNVDRFPLHMTTPGTKLPSLHPEQRPLGPEFGPAPTKKPPQKSDHFVVCGKIAGVCKPLQTMTKSKGLRWKSRGFVVLAIPSLPLGCVRSARTHAPRRRPRVRPVLRIFQLRQPPRFWVGWKRISVHEFDRQ